LKKGNRPATVNRYLTVLRYLVNKWASIPALASPTKASPLRADVINTAWHTAFDAGGDELKDLGGWKSRTMIDRYAKFATESLLSAASQSRAEECGT